MEPLYKQTTETFVHDQLTVVAHLSEIEGGEGYPGAEVGHIELKIAFQGEQATRSVFITPGEMTKFIANASLALGALVHP
jgi:hypothetical protein